jgi:hypothetical protein
MLDEIVLQRIFIKSLMIVLGSQFKPDDPEGGFKKILEDVSRVYEDIRPEESNHMAKEWGLPLSAEMQADHDTGAEFDKWLRDQFGENGTT